MRLHCDVGVEVIKGTVRLFAAVPAAFIHPFNLLISPSWSLVLLSPRDRNK